MAQTTEDTTKGPVNKFYMFTVEELHLLNRCVISYGARAPQNKEGQEIYKECANLQVEIVKALIVLGKLHGEWGNGGC